MEAVIKTMNNNKIDKAFKDLSNLNELHGYLTYIDIDSFAETYKLNLSEFDQLTNRIIKSGYRIIDVREKEPRSTRELPTDVAVIIERAEAGDIKSQVKLGDLYYFGNSLIGQSYSEAIEWYSRAALQDYPEGFFKLAECYFNGKGTSKNYKKAVEYYKKAADKKHYMAMCRLGECYLNGFGVAQNNVQAVLWYQKAADKEIPEALYMMGCCLLGGLGFPKNDKGAFVYFKLASEKNHDKAEKILGDLYKEGIGVPKSNILAFRSYLKSAQHGNVEAQRMVGLCYLNGWGIAVDKSSADYWLNKAEHS